MNPAERICLLLADDHRLFRDAIRAVLEPHFEVVGEAATGEEAITLAAHLRPHVVLLDLHMPGIGGIAAAHRIVKQSPAVKILVVSQDDDEAAVLETLVEAGAAGYLLKTAAAAEMIAAVRAVASGGRYISPSVAPTILGRMRNPHPGPSGPRLTRREREVLRLIGDGATSKEIAARLGISPKTAQVHRDNLKQKLNLRSTAAMVRYAIKHRLIRID